MEPEPEQPSFNQQVTPENELPSEPQANKQHLIYIGVGILALVLCAGFTYAMLTRTSNSEVPTATTTPENIIATTTPTTSSEPLPTQETKPPQLLSEATSTTQVQPTTTSVTPGYQTYRNEEWGFAFEYPEEWEVKEDSSRGYSTLYKLVLWPKQTGLYDLPDPVVFVVSFDEWCEGLLARKRARGDEIHTTTIDGYTAYYYDSQSVGLPTKVYLIELDGDRWIIAQTKTEHHASTGVFPGYEKELNHVLDTLTFID